MSERYVTSTHRTARRAHFGDSRSTLCGLWLTGTLRYSDLPFDDRMTCTRCVQVAFEKGTLTATEAVAALEYQPTAARARKGRYDTQEMDRALAAFKEGLRDTEVAERLRVSLRGVARRAGQGMADAGARTRFEWGYRIGLAEGRAGRRADA